MSNLPGSQRLRRNGSPGTTSKPSSGPLRATIPVSLMSQSTIQEGKPAVGGAQSTQPAIGKTQYNRSRQSPWRLRQLSPTPNSVEGTAQTNLDNSRIRRTASLDAIYLKGQWPRGNPTGPSLFVEKGTQTPEEWMDYDKKCCSSRGMEASPNRDRKQNKQRGFVINYQALNPLSIPVPSGSVSPSRVTASTNTECHGIAPSQAIPVPPKLNQSSRARNSVEGFNTEIEKLVWSSGAAQSCTKILEPTPDGHRAPIAELFKANCRTVDTQTPVQGFTTNSSSGNSSPSDSVSPSVWGPQDFSSRPTSSNLEEADYNSLSPEDFQGLNLGTSPRRRFLCREPPDGCEKVETLKVAEQPVPYDMDEPLRCPLKPNTQFVLQPSSSSAFCSLKKIASMKSNSSSHLFHPPYGSVVGEVCDRASSVPPQWPAQSSSVQHFD